jgi:ankyrin repeat protein
MALIAAATRNDATEVISLVNSGTDINQCDKVHKKKLICANLIERSRKELHAYILNCNLSFAQMQGGWTALMWASRGGCLPVVKSLLTLGASMEAKDDVRGIVKCLSYGCSHNNAKR